MLDAFWLQKTSQKPFQNEAETIKKSSLKTTCFQTSIFWCFGLHFGAFGSLLGLSWQALGVQNVAQEGGDHWARAVFFFNFCCFRGATFVFLRFGRVWGGFGKGFWRFGEGFLSGFREFCDHFYIDFYNFYRFRGATLLSLFFLAILDGWKK